MSKMNPMHPSNELVGLDDDRNTRFLGYSIAGLLLVLLFVWGTLAPLESAAIAPGVVEVEGKRKAIQHLEGGLVYEIRVNNGERVEQDQPLLVLDATRYAAERDIWQGRLYNQQAAADRLTAERDDQAEVSFRPSLIEASSSDPRARNAISSEQALFLARSADRSAEEAVLASEKKGLELVLDSKQLVEDSLRQEIVDLQDLLDEGYVDKQRLRELERSRAQLLGELSDLRVSIEEVELRLSQLRKRYKRLVVDELVETLELLYDNEQQYTAADDRVQRATIRAPVSGTILNLLPNTIGEVISPGETILEIVPQVDRLVIQARVSPMDIDRVRIGQSAEVQFSVFKDAYSVSGSLSKLSADRLIDENTDMPYYAAEIRLVEEDMALLDGVTLMPGMPAEVLIKTGDRTMLGYLTSPMNRIFSRSLTED
jgi:epimerase transport system membrane fusion protein